MADNYLKDILGGVGKLTPFKQASNRPYNWGGETYLSAGDWDVKSAVDPLLSEMNKAMGKGDVCPKGYKLVDGKCVKKEKGTDYKDDPTECPVGYELVNGKCVKKKKGV